MLHPLGFFGFCVFTSRPANVQNSVPKLSLDRLRIPSLEPSDLITVVAFISRPPNVLGDLESVSSGTLQSWDGVGLSLPGAPGVSQPRVTGKPPGESFGKTPRNTVALNPQTQRASPLTLSSSTSSTAGRRGRALELQGCPGARDPGCGTSSLPAIPGSRVGSLCPVLPALAPRGHSRLFVVLCVNRRDQRCS